MIGLPQTLKEHRARMPGRIPLDQLAVLDSPPVVPEAKLRHVECSGEAPPDALRNSDFC